MKAVAQAVVAAHPHVDVLVNNAGVAMAGTFEQMRSRISSGSSASISGRRCG